MYYVGYSRNLHPEQMVKQRLKRELSQLSGSVLV